MTGEHSSKQYDMDLETIRSKVLLMGGLVESHFHDAMSCFRTGNVEQAEAVILSDLEVNRLEVSLDDMCSHLIVKRQPAANDLRTVVATGKVITDLERIGDESTKIARIARDAHTSKHNLAMFSGYETVRVLAHGVADMLHQALDAFARLDQAKAVQLIAQDAIVDNDFRSIMRNLITFMMEDPRSITRVLNIMWSLRALERIGDHGRNLAQYVIYLVNGEDVRHTDLEK